MRCVVGECSRYWSHSHTTSQSLSDLRYAVTLHEVSGDLFFLPEEKQGEKVGKPCGTASFAGGGVCGGRLLRSAHGFSPLHPDLRRRPLHLDCLILWLLWHMASSRGARPPRGSWQQTHMLSLWEAQGHATSWAGQVKSSCKMEIRAAVSGRSWLPRP